MHFVCVFLGLHFADITIFYLIVCFYFDKIEVYDLRNIMLHVDPCVCISLVGCAEPYHICTFGTRAIRFYTIQSQGTTCKHNIPLILNVI